MWVSRFRFSGPLIVLYLAKSLTLAVVTCTCLTSELGAVQDPGKQTETGNGLPDYGIVNRRVHLRATKTREWSRFPKKFPGSRVKWIFDARKNSTPVILRIYQADVKQTWSVYLNSQKIGILERDQNRLVSLFDVPANLLASGKNELEIRAEQDRLSDDVWVGPARIILKNREKYLSESTLNVIVTDDRGQPAPCRITIRNRHDYLAPVGFHSSKQKAVRTGIVYCLDGKAEIPLPAGAYQVFATRGPEFTRPHMLAPLEVGDSLILRLKLRRVVDTRGWVSCDPHVHTVTFSKHGDCTIQERMITLAGENVELPIATDHNLQIDYRSEAAETGANRFFTPLIGNEVTTEFGHFNAFPFTPTASLPDHGESSWKKLIPEIFSKPNVGVVILNHPRDVHRGYRPFAPENFNAVSGESLSGRPFLFNAMEVINSGAQQSDQFQLFRDWMAIVNRGHNVVPIGSSDSHDVNKFIVGQARTYIQGDDSRPGSLDSSKLVNNLAKGRVTVSCGLFAQIMVNGKYGPGDIVPPADSYRVECIMKSPHWISGDRLQLFQNGFLVREKSIDPEKKGRWLNETRVVWDLKKQNHDSFLSLLVSGPAPFELSWPLAKPYQPVSPDWDPRYIGLTGAVYLDQNGDGKFNSANEIASNIISNCRNEKGKLNLAEALARLAECDTAVAIQAASIIHKELNLFEESRAKLWKTATPSIRAGFRQYLDAWRASESAKITNR